MNLETRLITHKKGYYPFNEAYAADNTHDVFLKILENAHSFQPQSKFSTWIFSLAYNRHKNNLRHFEVCKRFEDSFSSQNYILNPDIEKSLDDKSRSLLVREMLSNLEEDTRVLFYLRFVDELSIPQISSVCNLPEGTIKSRLFYSLQKLSKQFSYIKLNDWL